MTSASVRERRVRALRPDPSPRRRDVRRQLRRELGDAGEAALPAEAVAQPDVDDLVVDVVVEVEQVGLEQPEALAPVERRPVTDRDRRRMAPASAVDPAGPDAVEEPVALDGQVGGREPDRPAALVAALDTAAHDEHVRIRDCVRSPRLLGWLGGPPTLVMYS